MNKIISTYLRLTASAILMVLATAGARAQSWTMIPNDTIHIDACQYVGGTIYDDGGPDGDYSNNFNGWVVINASPGVIITLSGSYDLEGCCDYLEVWDGTIAEGTQLWNNCGSGSITLTASSGIMTLYFHSDGSVHPSGFALDWSQSGNIGKVVPRCPAAFLTQDKCNYTGRHRAQSQRKKHVSNLVLLIKDRLQQSSRNIP